MRSSRSSKLVLAVFSLLFLLSLAGAAFAAPQTTCPVMGGKINKDIHVDYKGQRIYFCCEACPKEFEKDPEKYLAKMKEMGQEPELIKQSGAEDDSKAEHTEQKETGAAEQKDSQEQTK